MSKSNTNTSVDSSDEQAHNNRSRAFSPWMRDLKWGTVFVVPGALTLYYELSQPPVSLNVMLVGLALLGIGGLLLNRGMARWTGKQVETSSIRALSFPEHWTSKPNYMLSSGGDIDLYVESPDGERFAIEIKSIEAVVIKHSFLGMGQSRLLTPAGKALKDDPQIQTLRNAEAVAATPVLWLPKASGKTVRLKSGVIVVRGGKRQLFKAIGCKSGWSLW